MAEVADPLAVRVGERQSLKADVDVVGLVCQNGRGIRKADFCVLVSANELHFGDAGQTVLQHPNPSCPGRRNFDLAADGVGDNAIHRLCYGNCPIQSCVLRRVAIDRDIAGQGTRALCLVFCIRRGDHAHEHGQTEQQRQELACYVFHSFPPIRFLR